MYYVLLPNLSARTVFIDRLKARGVYAVFHYVPLHSSPFGRSAGKAAGELPVTDDVAERLVRLPLWLGLEEQQREVIGRVIEAIGESAGK